ncbi:hypothetical protein DFQ28_007797 [Apophysomyces sp. BC1034]|nr:hypothetical protein DFQ28_007797 [Apophysomyces sp. BC1034]
MLEFATTNKRLFAISVQEFKATQTVEQASLLRSLDPDEQRAHFKQCFSNALQLQPRRPKLEALLIHCIDHLDQSNQFDAAKYVLAELAKSDHDQTAQYIALFVKIPHIVRYWPNVEESRSDPLHDHRSRERRSMLVNLLDCALRAPSKHCAETKTATMRTTAMLEAILKKLPPSDVAPRFDALLEIAERTGVRLAIALAKKLPQLPSQGRTARFDTLLSIARHHCGKLAQVLWQHLDKLPAEDRASRSNALRLIAQDGELSLVR